MRHLCGFGKQKEHWYISFWRNGIAMEGEAKYIIETEIYYTEIELQNSLSLYFSWENYGN